MNKDESKRLKTLQGDFTKVGNFGLSSVDEKLTFPDLLLLLRKDKTLRDLICEIVAERPETETEDRNTSCDEAYDEDKRGLPPTPLTAPQIESPVMRIAPPTVDALRRQVAPELALLQVVQADSEIAATWLGEPSEDEGRQLLRLAVCAAQWDLLSELWEKLANRCKQARRGASAAELEILRGALALHNLRWLGREAKLVEVTIDAAYDYEHHQRGTPTGDSVQALWLPGLVNAGGQLQKKPLVQT